MTLPPSRPPFAILGGFVRLNQNGSGALPFAQSSASSRLLGTTTVAVERSGTVGLALRRLSAFFADKFIDAEVDYALMGADCVFPNINLFCWHGMELIGSVTAMLFRRGTEFIKIG